MALLKAWIPQHVTNIGAAMPHHKGKYIFIGFGGEESIKWRQFCFQI